MAIRAVVSDFGGVLTTPLAGGFARLHERSGIAPEQFGLALAASAAVSGEHPLHALEAGRLSEPEFLTAVSGGLSAQLGRPVVLDGFGEAFLSGLAPNAAMLEALRELRDVRGLRLAICTNNVREWSQRWQAMIDAPRLFELIVDSSEVGIRKPDPGIYETTLAALGLPAGEVAFLDDLAENVAAARELGMHGVWFQDTAQAVADLDRAITAAA